MHVRSMEGDERVTPLELFFDLVFVFAITQVTGFLAANDTGEGLLRGGLLLAALWWAWAAYAWLTNTLDPEEGAVRLAVFAAIAAMLIVSLATPNAFGTDGGAAAGCRPDRGRSLGDRRRRLALVVLFRLGRLRRPGQAGRGDGRGARQA